MSVTGLSAARMLAIEAGTIVDSEIIGDHLILTLYDGSTVDTGIVKGAAGANGLTPILAGSSISSLVIGLGEKIFAIDPAMNVPFPVGSIVRAIGAVPTNYMTGNVTAANNASVTINVTEKGGAGTFAVWKLALGSFAGPPGDITVSPASGSLTGNYPSPGIANGAVGTAQILDGSVTPAKLAVGSNYRPDLITPFKLNGPMVLGHRGSHNLYPENSIEGFRETGKAGFAAELDLRLLSSGQVVVIHDTTVDRTMTGTGTVSAMTLSTWRSLSILPQIQNGQQALGAMWEDVLADMGGRYLLVPEVKVAGTQDAIMAPVIARNLQRSVIFQSFDLVTAQAIATAGCCSMFLTTGSLTGITPADLFASGVEFVGFDLTVSAANVAAAKAAGLKVLIYTVDTQSDWDLAIGTDSADGVFSDDPWFVSNRFATRSSDPFQTRDAWPHLRGYTTTLGYLEAFTLANTRIQYAPPVGLRRYNYAGTDASTLAISLGWAGQNRGPNVRVRFKSNFLEDSSSQTRWVGMFVGTQTSRDTVFHDAAFAGQQGYHFLVRRNGIMEIYYLASNAAPLNIATSTDPADLAAAGQRGLTYKYECLIDATNVTMMNLSTGLSVTVAHSTFRGPSRVDLTSNGTNAEWEDIGIEDV